LNSQIEELEKKFHLDNFSKVILGRSKGGVGENKKKIKHLSVSKDHCVLSKN
jgi:hypothetical protein